ncbi:MAG: hypothetical protein ACRECN_09250, partial [Methylocella sp.]
TPSCPGHRAGRQEKRGTDGIEHASGGDKKEQKPLAATAPNWRRHLQNCGDDCQILSFRRKFIDVTRAGDN